MFLQRQLTPVAAGRNVQFWPHRDCCTGVCPLIGTYLMTKEKVRAPETAQRRTFRRTNRTLHSSSRPESSPDRQGLGIINRPSGFVCILLITEMLDSMPASAESAPPTLAVPSAAFSSPLPELRVSCQSCRQRKQKCDRITPECGRCVGLGVKCFYPGSRRSHTGRRRQVANRKADSCMFALSITTQR
jgi:hypothetical protein